MKLNDRGMGFREVHTCDNCANIIRIEGLGLECGINGLYVATTTVCDEYETIGDESDEK